MASPHPSGWSRHVNQSDGRPYWSHPQHGSSWTKPRDLKSPLELELENSPWDEYETNGRKYWVHKESKETTWNMPTDISETIKRFKRASEGAPTPPPRPLPPPNAPTGPASPALTSHTGALVAPGGYSPAGLPPRPAGALPPGVLPSSSSGLQPHLAPSSAVPTYATHAEAARAFKDMLQRLGVSRAWTWEVVMKEAITEPAYKALHTLSERKAAFEEFLVEEDRRLVAERDQSLARCRKEWTRAMDKVGGGVGFEEGVKSWWSWERGARVLSDKYPEVWALPRNDDERKILFDEYIAKLRTDEETRKREMRGRNMDKVTAILQSLALDLAGPVRWSDARALFMRTPEWHRDPELQRIEPIDLLTVFEDEVHRAEKELAEARGLVAEEKRRRGRKARDDFNTLLDELVASKHLTAGTPWSFIYPHLSRDPRYLALLGLPGSSSPLDLFWDRVDDLDVAAEERLVFLEGVAEKRGLTVGEETSEAEWRGAVEADERVKDLGDEAVREAFETLHHRAVRHARDARRRADKALRLAIDDLRYLFKRLDEPPVDVDTDSFDEVVRRGDVVEAKEWRALEGKDEARRSAWDKFVRRTKVRSACSSLSCSCMRCHERKGATQPTDSPLHPLHLTSLRLLVLPLHSSPRPHHPQEKRAEREAAEQGRTERDRAYERQRDLERATEREREGGAGRSRRASSAADAAEVGRKRPGAEQGEEGADGGERAKRLRLGEEVVVVPEGGGGEGDVTMRTSGRDDGPAEEGEL
ncbi:hypothetical protein DMC30DRAFT_274469 [Rhodotorula diobovata]|uniref:WW domain-containing protein n=1 Tax=Rhodotorula diobovata TaxID=5288 RepID=A0A5C5FV08_9BASI|nr:hypothetical protein DMC30DRAFT_274469 [Rhodotorula diobovata]